MNATIKLLTADKIAKWGLILSSSILLVELIYIGIFYLSLPPVLPIFNQLPWGEQRLGIRATIFLPLIIALTFFVFNFFLVSRLRDKLPLLSRMLSITTFLISILSLFFIVRTLQLII
ncbi:MAG TPA: hypothetical protein VM077_04920 [Candidatus Limnocylindrales bacterium]|nr:hypothetical protein [Candidatus Limnocylindrales bacterium]